MIDPRTCEWYEGELPPVEDVAYDCYILLISKDYMGIVLPHGDVLSPLRWCNDTFMPQWGTTRPTGIWTWVRKGSKPRPPEVRTWAEHYP